MLSNNLFVIPANVRPFDNPSVIEYAIVSFPGTDYRPIVVGSIRGLKNDDITDYIKSLGINYKELNIECHERNEK